ncbi:hypothetical protein AB0H34_40765, partial [Saccharopolyspora shandongensis]|uniref:CHASE3 domain-containing protein n=1 Tax=Saccharopolyspora shandongensis TaxID=418495 RepID=UPI0034696977
MVDIEFDPAFDWLWVLVAGQKAPRVDVAAARALAESWRDSGVTLEEMGRSLGSLAAVAERSIGGGAGRAFRKRVDELAAAVPQLVALARQQSAALLDLALNVELGVYSMMIEIAFFAASIVWALVSPFTAPLVPAFFTAARIAVARILEKLGWAVRLLVEALQEGAQEVAQDALAQIIQIMEGNRHVWDTLSTVVSGIMGGAAGGLMGAMFMGMKKLGPQVADSMFFHGAAEASAEVVVDAAATGILGGSMDDLGLSAVGGGFTGMVDKGAADAGEKIGELVNGVGIVDGPDIPAIDMPDAVSVPVVQTGVEPGHSLTTGSGFNDADSRYGRESGDASTESGDTRSESGDADAGYGSDTDSGPAGSGVSAHGPTRIGPLTTTLAAAGVVVGGVPGQGGGPSTTPGTAADIPSPGTHLPTPGAMDPATGAPVSDVPNRGSGVPAAGAANPVAGAPAPGAWSPGVGVPPAVDGLPAADAPAPAEGRALVEETPTLTANPSVPTAGVQDPAANTPAPGTAVRSDLGAPVPGTGTPSSSVGASVPITGAPGSDLGKSVLGAVVPGSDVGEPAPGTAAPGLAAAGKPVPGTATPGSGVGTSVPGTARPGPDGRTPADTAVTPPLRDGSSVPKAPPPVAASHGVVGWDAGYDSAPALPSIDAQPPAQIGPAGGTAQQSASETGAAQRQVPATNQQRGTQAGSSSKGAIRPGDLLFILNPDGQSDMDELADNKVDATEVATPRVDVSWTFGGSGSGRAVDFIKDVLAQSVVDAEVLFGQLHRAMGVAGADRLATEIAAPLVAAL